MPVITEKRKSVDRGVPQVNLRKIGNDVADKTISNIGIHKKAIAPARAIAMIKNPSLETITEAVEWILEDYVRLHDLKLTERPAGKK